MKHLLKLQDLTKEEILSILNLADQLKYERNHGIVNDCLKGVGFGMAMILAHDSAARTTTVEALPAVIEGYQAAGYTFSALHPGVRQVTMGYPKMR